MKLRAHFVLLLICVAALVLSGCAKHIVHAASPSVVTPSPLEPKPVATAPAPPPVPVPPPEITQPAPELVPSPAAEPRPPRPRPAATPAAVASPAPSAPVPPPRISPVLSAADQQRLTQLATDQIRIAERNLQTAMGKRLNSLQQDLSQKVQGFLSQAHEAIRANDWVRAQNLAEKAQVLSTELVKSF
jgi:outer membrane biosynthesis protein TonB